MSLLNLTEAERRILHHFYMYDHETREAAQLLNLSPYTLNAHLRAIYKKLGVKSKTHAILLYARSRENLVTLGQEKEFMKRALLIEDCHCELIRSNAFLIKQIEELKRHMLGEVE